VKQFGFCAISLLLFFIGGCTSLESSDTSATQTAVPGEKISDEGRVGPGTGPNASVRW
jgi:hypothetical protein